jgi:eukaryotic-like serine/threonine-protein kinase
VDSKRFEQIELLYHAALARKPEERLALLDQADPEVRREVEALLKQESTGGILDQRAADLMTESRQTAVIAGSRLGPYSIEALLGHGGMGTVFRATDTRLGRAVAIKVSQERFSDRFEREARIIAALNHPNICTLHDVGLNYLVMELVEGETLAARLKRGKLAIEATIQYGAQIADALAAAHAKGIVHRDLKPGNVMITKTGVKVLDFGLAKSAQDETLTGANAVMGTPAYMAPEQRDGQPCDARADIYALGLVIYEMATGMRPPAGERPLFDSWPGQLGHVVERCLAQDLEERWQSARDLKSELEWAARDVRAQFPAENSGRTGRLWLIPTAVVLLALIALAMVYFQKPASDTRVIFATILPPNKTSFALYTMASLSPAGTHIAFSATSEDGKTQLWVRPLNGTESLPMPGTSNGTLPFWSPDGMSLGFFAEGRLKRIEISGGPPVDLCDASLGFGGSWATDGTIVFAPHVTSPLFRVPASGGQRVQLTSLNATRKEASHNFPQFLPDNRHFLYHSESASAESSGIYLGSLDGGDPKVLLRGISNAVFGPPDHILFLQNGALMARRFDPNRYELSSDSVMIAQLPGTADVASGLSASGNGVLAYVAQASEGGQQMEWFNRAGKSEGTVGEPGLYYTPRLSPDGGKIAVAVAPPGPTRDLWIFNQAHHNETHLTFDQLHNWTPVWSPDATQLAYSSNPKGKFHIYVRSADGLGARQTLLEDDAIEYVDSWSSDGKYVAYAREDPSGKPGWDIWVLPLFGDMTPFPVTQSQSNKEDPSISPDRKWLAYDSDESGQWEVYVVPFPHGEGKWQASKGGARQPRWRNDSRELFFLGTGNRLMTAEVQDKGASLEIHAPQTLFQTHSAPSPYRSYDVTGDGEKFIIVTQHAKLNADAVTIIANWPVLLQKK